MYLTHDYIKGAVDPARVLGFATSIRLEPLSETSKESHVRLYHCACRIFVGYENENQLDCN